MRKLRSLITETLYNDQTYSDGTGEWRVGDIIDCAQNKPRQDLDVEALFAVNFDTSDDSFDEAPGSPEFVERAERSDLNYPIVVVRYPDGDFVADGNHRLWKAHSGGMKTIKGYVITVKELHELPHVQCSVPLYSQYVQESRFLIARPFLTLLTMLLMTLRER